MTLPQSLPPELAEKIEKLKVYRQSLRNDPGEPKLAHLYGDGQGYMLDKALPLIDELCSVITTLENPWRDIKDAPRDGKPLIGLCSYLYPGDKDLTVSVNEITWHNEFWQDHEGNHPEGFYTHFQYINPPSPVAPKVRERCIYSVARMLYRKYDSDYDAEGLTIKDFIEEATGYVDAVLRELNVSVGRE